MVSIQSRRAATPTPNINITFSALHFTASHWVSDLHGDGHYVVCCQLIVRFSLNDALACQKHYLLHQYGSLLHHGLKTMDRFQTGPFKCCQVHLRSDITEVDAAKCLLIKWRSGPTLCHMQRETAAKRSGFTGQFAFQ